MQWKELKSHRMTNWVLSWKDREQKGRKSRKCWDFPAFRLVAVTEKVSEIDWTMGLEQMQRIDVKHANAVIAYRAIESLFNLCWQKMWLATNFFISEKFRWVFRKKKIFNTIGHVGPACLHHTHLCLCAESFKYECVRTIDSVQISEIAEEKCRIFENVEDKLKLKH